MDLHITQMGDKSNRYRILERKPLTRRPLEDREGGGGGINWAKERGLIEMLSD
jgi:hypothetical protein